MTKDKKPTLLPCPFCGGEAKFERGTSYVLVKCNGETKVEDMIHSISTVWFDKKYENEAVEAWNRRTK